METVSPNGPEREPSPAEVAAAYTGEIPLGQPESVHYDPDRLPRVSPCNLDLDDVPAEYRSTNPAAVTCALCAATLVDGQLGEPGADTQPLPAVDSWVPEQWCKDGWHYAAQQPDGPCPGCGQGDRAADQLLDRERQAEQPTAPAPRLVVVASPAPNTPPQLAEVKKDKGGTTVEVIYTESRTWANVARKRVTPVLACRLKVGGTEVHGAHSWYGNFDAGQESQYWYCLGAAPALAERFERRAAERLVELVDEEPLPDTDVRGALADDLQRMGLMPEPAPVGDAWVDITALVTPGAVPDEVVVEIRPSAPARRTVGLEVLTPELRDLVPEPTERSTGRIGIVVRTGAHADIVPETDGPWRTVHGDDNPLKIIRGLISTMISGARGLSHGGEAMPELLVPGADVLAVLAGRPVGGYTATVEVTYQAVKPGWWLLTDTEVDGQRDSVWQLVVDRADECADEACTNARRDCRVLTVLGRGVQHVVCWYPAHVRIPADTAVTA